MLKGDIPVYAKLVGVTLAVPISLFIGKRLRNYFLEEKYVHNYHQSTRVRIEQEKGETGVYRNAAFPDRLVDNLDGMTTLEELWR